MRAFILVLLSIAALPVVAQRGLDLRAEGDATTVMVRGYVSEQAVEPSLQAVWRLPPDSPATFSHQWLSAPEGDHALMLRPLLLAAIDQYLDQRIHFERNGVVADQSDERLLADMNAMAASAADAFGASEGFSGFTEATMDQLERVSHIDWSQASFGVDAGGDQDKYLAIYYYVRSQRQELGRQLRADLLPLAGVDVLMAAPRQDAFTTGRGVQVPTVCSTVYDDRNFLCALDLGVDTMAGIADGHLTDEFLAHLAAQARETIADTAPVATTPEWQPRIRKRDRWLKAEFDIINERIDRLDQRKELWALRDRMDDIEGRLDDMGLEVQELREEGNIDGTQHDNPLANLSELTGNNITVRFSRGLSTLDAESRVMLNEVFEQLARAPQDRVLITGFTDRSGDPGSNLALSERRARVVRDYLMARGIAPERLLLNYYGDSRSTGRDPMERRVEVEWLR